MATPKEEIGKYLAVASSDSQVLINYLNSLNALKGVVSILGTTDIAITASTVANTITISPTSNIPRSSDLTVLNSICNFTPGGSPTILVGGSYGAMTSIELVPGNVSKLDMTNYNYARVVCSLSGIMPSTASIGTIGWIGAFASTIAGNATSYTPIDGVQGTNIAFTSTSFEDIVLESTFFSIPTSNKKDMYITAGVVASTLFSGTSDYIEVYFNSGFTVQFKR